MPQTKKKSPKPTSQPDESTMDPQPEPLVAAAPDVEPMEPAASAASTPPLTTEQLRRLRRKLLQKYH